MPPAPAPPATARPCTWPGWPPSASGGWAGRAVRSSRASRGFRLANPAENEQLRAQSQPVALRLRRAELEADPVALEEEADRPSALHEAVDVADGEHRRGAAHGAQDGA